MRKPLADQNIILGITGGIAAYKSAELCRLLKKEGASVRVVMTAGACEFITPLTLQALSGEPVSTQLLDEDAEAGMGHIELAKWADLVLIAPATANTIAKLVSGLADDLLGTLVLATEAQLVVAPAMNQIMWSNPVTQQNTVALKELYGPRVCVLGPDSGEQACGDVGYGRMLEPIDILAALKAEQSVAEPICRVVITAGPTREPLDPVRYISNHSSGKMGYSLAQAFRDLGACVTLISGPVALTEPAGVRKLSVQTADEMYESALASVADGCDIFIGAAAVADYSPVSCADQKIKKAGDEMAIQLRQNRDIIASVAKQLDAKSICVGFAAETNDVVKYAQNKLERKGLDMIIANDVSRSDIGFNSEDNAVTVVTSHASDIMPKMKKSELARSLADRILKAFHNKQNL